MLNPIIDINDYIKISKKKIKLIYFSTFQIYTSQKIINESTPLNLTKRYSYNHYCAEKKLLNIKKKFNVDLKILRISNCYGIFLKPKKEYFEPLINKLVYDSLKTKKIVIHSNGTAEKDYIYITDLVQFVLINILQNKKKIS